MYSIFEVRLGYEKVTLFGQRLKLNKLCATYKVQREPEQLVTLDCQGRGKYLTVQLMSYGSLDINEIWTYPKSSKVIYLNNFYCQCLIDLLFSVDGKLNFNTPWSLCSVSCGNGTTHRELPCVGPFHGGKPCIGNRTQVRPCNIFPCPSKALHRCRGYPHKFRTHKTLDRLIWQIPRWMDNSQWYLTHPVGSPDYPIEI